MELDVNGETVALDGIDPDMPLLWVLRDHLQLTGTKFGGGKSQCGTCTVHVDGKAVRSCMYPVSEVGTRAVVTIEGLAPDGDHPLQRAWAEHGVPQCGYCQTGQIMTAAALLAETPQPTDDDIDLAMTPNLCRCGTYTRIRAAIKSAGAAGAAAAGAADR